MQTGRSDDAEHPGGDQPGRQLVGQASQGVAGGFATPLTRLGLGASPQGTTARE